MRLSLPHGPRGHARFGLVWGGLLVSGALALRLGLRPPGACPFHTLTGHPCPTCGSTRSLAHLASLQLGAAFRLQPLATAAFLVLGLWALVSALGREPKVEWTDRERRHALGLLGLLSLLNWVYLWGWAGV